MVGLTFSLMTIGRPSPAQEATSGTDLPPSLASLEYLIGQWKGPGVPKDNPSQRFRGWNETHSWAWIFAKGKPVGLSVTIEGGKIISKGTLKYDEARKLYLLEGDEPGDAGKHVEYAGKFDASGKLLTLERADASGTRRILLRPNANYIRYTMNAERKSPGSSKFSPLVEVGVTKEGESFAAGSTTVERAKCIVTGGAAAMTVTYQGQSYPICCSGCLEEFNDNPKKYLDKLALKMKDGNQADAAGPARTARIGRNEDAFGGGESEEQAGDAPETKETSSKEEKQAKTGEEKSAKSGKESQKAASRAATALRLAENLEKSGKTETALKSYRQVIKDFPGTVQAKTAAARVKALEAR
jgi:YHS domain-containing protein